MHVAKNWIVQVPTLRNPYAAYVLAGYQENRSNAARLNAAQDIQKRVGEIQSLGAERAAITVETLIAEAEAARSKAMGEKGGANAAVAAIFRTVPVSDPNIHTLRAFPRMRSDARGYP